MVDFKYTQMRYVLERTGLTWTDIPPVKQEDDVVMQQVRRAGSASGETLLNSWLLLIVFANVPCI